VIKSWMRRKDGRKWFLEARVLGEDGLLKAEVKSVYIPGHAGVEGNERADKVAKQAANKPPNTGSGEVSLAFTRRACTNMINAHKRSWLARELAQRPQQAQRTYRPSRGWQLDPIAAAAPKNLASRLFQLKTGHATIGTYLHR